MRAQYMKDWYFLVLLGIRGDLEGAFKHDTIAESWAGGSKWSKHDLSPFLHRREKKIASQWLSAFCEARESSKEPSIGIRCAVSADINDVESSVDVTTT